MLRRLHHWMGILIAAWLVIATVSGGLLLFKDEYYGWRYPALPDAPMSVAANGAVTESIIASSRSRIATLALPTDSLPAYHVYYADGSEALFHPQSAERIAEWGVFDALPAFLFELHAYMLLGEFGHTLIGLVGLIAAVNICVGFALWWQRRATFQVRYLVPRSTRKKHLIRGHAAQGAVMSAALAVLVLSGSAMVFPGPALSGLSGLLGSSDKLRPLAEPMSAPAESIDWDYVFSAAAERFPEGQLRFVSIPAEPAQPLVLRVRNAQELHPNGRSYVVVDPERGEILETVDATQTGLGPITFNALYPIHAGKTGWPGYRLVLALLSLSMLYITASGVYLYLKRSKLAQSPRVETRAVRSGL